MPPLPFAPEETNVPPAETTKAGSISRVLRLSMLRPDGRQIDYDEPFKNNEASYNEACLKLSERERQKTAEGWDKMARPILQTEDNGTDIVTRALVGKEWDFIGDPAVPPGRAGQPPELAVDQPSTNGSSPVAPHPTVRGRTVGTNDRSEAFLEALGELCMAHKMVIVGDDLRLEDFSMKAFRRLLAMGE